MSAGVRIAAMFECVLPKAPVPTGPHRSPRRRGATTAMAIITGGPTGGTTIITTGATIAAITGRSSTSDSISIRSAGTITATGSAGGCGRATTAATTG